MVRPDLYTKVILTVIALCLVVLVTDKVNIIPSAFAHGAGSPVLNRPASYGLVPVNEDGSITVKLQSSEVIDVQLRGIDESPSLRWEAIRVKSE